MTRRRICELHLPNEMDVVGDMIVQGEEWALVKYSVAGDIRHTRFRKPRLPAMNVYPNVSLGKALK